MPRRMADVFENLGLGSDPAKPLPKELEPSGRSFLRRLTSAQLRRLLPRSRNGTRSAIREQRY